MPSASVSIDSAPSMIGSASPGSQIQIDRPIAASSDDRGQRGHEHALRTKRARQQAHHQHDDRAADHGEQRRERLVVDRRAPGPGRAARSSDRRHLRLARGAPRCVAALGALEHQLRVDARARSTTATSGAIAARPSRPSSRDSTRGPARLCMLRWKTRIMYTAASTTPALATRPNTSWSSKAPNRIRSSPTKLGEPGHGQRGQRDDQEQRGEHRRAQRHAAQPRQRLAAARPARPARR